MAAQRACTASESLVRSSMRFKRRTLIARNHKAIKVPGASACVERLASSTNREIRECPTMSLRVLIYFVSFALFVQSKGDASQVGRKTQERATTELRARIEASPVLPFKGVHFAAQPPSIGWQSGAVSGIAVGSKETIYEIQRGDKAYPVVVLDRDGKVLRSWGKGEFKDPAQHTHRSYGQHMDCGCCVFHGYRVFFVWQKAHDHHCG
jgi:hypothetical protein